MRNPNYRKSNAGIGIIEVLVALVVISLGVLGMASLQLTGMKHSSSGYNRSMATLFVENLASRMRSNQVGVSNMLYSGFDSDALNCSTLPTPYCQESLVGAAEVCSFAEIATFDLYSIACGLPDNTGAAVDGIKDTLGNGRIQVVCDDTPCLATSNYSVAITWNEGRTTSNTEGVDLKRVQVRFNP